MPPKIWSRHTFSKAYRDAYGDLVLTEPTPYRYRDFEDNRFHVVVYGETLFELAKKYFPSFPRPDGLWWIIADFQPEPIHDPTIQLTPGDTLVIPSERTVVEEIFSESRRDE